MSFVGHAAEGHSIIEAVSPRSLFDRGGTVAGMSQDLAALTTAACTVLERENTVEQVQQQLETARQWAGEMRQNAQPQAPSQTTPGAGQFAKGLMSLLLFSLCSVEN